MRLRQALGAVLATVAIQPLIWGNAPIARAEPPTVDKGVLVVYDSLALGTPNEGNVEALLRLLSAMGVPATLMPMMDAGSGDLNAFKGIVAIRNMPELEDGYARLIERMSGYNGSYAHIGDGMDRDLAARLRLRAGMTESDSARLSTGPLKLADYARQSERMPYIADADGIGYGEVVWASSGMRTPFGARSGKTAFVPVFRNGAASALAMAYLLKDWLGITAEGRLYLLYKEIYPFTDLDLLENAADELYGAGIPFIYSVRPVYRNTDYPAMQRYTEMMRAAQSRNGTIFANAPVLSPVAGIQTDTLKEKTALFLNALAESGIVPLGTGADAAYMWRRDLGYSAHGMEPFDSAVLYAPDNPALLARTGEIEPRIFASSMLSVDWDELAPYWKAERAVPLPLDIAVTFDFYSSEEEMKAAVRELRDSWLPFADYKNGSHSAVTAGHVMSSEGGFLYLDGEQVGLERTAGAVSSDYEYREETPQSFVPLLTLQNYVYLILIGCSLMVFGIILLAGLRYYRRKYLKGRGERDE